MAIEVYVQFEHAVFQENVLFPFPLVTATWIGDYFEIRRCGPNCSVRFSYFLMVFFWIFHFLIQHCFACSARKLSNGEIIPAPLYWRTEALLRKRRCGSNSERKLWSWIEFVDFFLVRAASLFTLQTFGAQINWRVISMKVLFDPQRFLSNKSPIHFAGESGKGNTFLNGKRHVQNKNGHRSPRSQTYAQQL